MVTQLLEISGVSQEYPGVKALKQVTFSLAPGKVLGLVGENGAGKSTLIRILGGLEQPTEGGFSLRGVPQRFKNSAASQAAGISVVSQEFRLVSELSIADNIFLGSELVSQGFVSRKETHRRTAEVLQMLGLDLSPNQLVGELTVGDRQLIEIARALAREFDVIVMDEPTAALNGSEISRLHSIVRRIQVQGKSVIYVSHHLSEIFEICDEVAVLRDGSLVSHQPTAKITQPELVELMLGAKPAHFENHAAGQTADDTQAALLEVKNLRLVGFEHEFNLKVAPGEILGLAGLVGSGRAELTRALFGEHMVRSGAIYIDGSELKHLNARKAIQHGLFMLSDDRKSEGILAHLDVTENSVVSRSRDNRKVLDKLFPMRNKELSLFEDLRQQMRIRVPHGRQLIGNLSGGNQQKVLLGRALLSGCKVLILNEPTRGVDVGAKIDIYELVRGLADSGVAVIISSSDAPELAMIADRCVVYFAGQPLAELRNNDVTEENIVSASVGELGQVVNND